MLPKARKSRQILTELQSACVPRIGIAVCVCIHKGTVLALSCYSNCLVVCGSLTAKLAGQVVPTSMCACV